MKTKTILLALLLFSVTASADVLFLGANRDGVSDVIKNPLSIGVLTWSDDNKNTGGVFGSICPMAYDDRIRLELGVAFNTADGFEVHPLTGLTAPIGEHFIAGVWYGAFWNLYPGSDDPYGLMLGYRF